LNKINEPKDLIISDSFVNWKILFLTNISIFRDLCTISILRQDKAKIVDQSVWNRLGWNPNRVKYKDAFHQKAQFTGVNEHFETIFNAVMAEKTTRAKVSFNTYGQHHLHPA